MAIVYFGTFDPFHENHFYLVKYLVNKYSPKKFAIIPNNDGQQFKPDSMPLFQRLQLIETRFKQEEKHFQRIVEIVSPHSTPTNWQGRQHLACQFGKKHRLPILFVAVGLDSIIQSFERFNQTQSSPLDKFILPIRVLPRKGYDLPAIPAIYQSKVTIEHEYSDPLLVSSTLIRQLLKNNSPVPPEYCHPSVVSQLLASMVQQTPPTNLKAFHQLEWIAVFIGPPGAGKTTRAQTYAAEKMAICLSTGDIYRNAKENNTPEYQLVDSFRQQPADYRLALSRFMTGQLEKKLQSVSRVVIDGFKAGDLTTFIQQFCPFNEIHYIHNEREIILARVAERKRADDSEIKSRLHNYDKIYLPALVGELQQLYPNSGINFSHLIKREYQQLQVESQLSQNKNETQFYFHTS